MSGSSDSRVYIWQTARPRDAPYVLEGHTGEVTGVDWSCCDAGRVASCSDDGTMRIWDVRRLEQPRRRQPAPRAAGSRWAEAAPAAPPPPAAARDAAAPLPPHASQDENAAQAVAPAGPAQWASPVPVPTAAAGRIFVRPLTAFFQLPEGGAVDAGKRAGRIHLDLKKAKSRR